MVLQVLWYFWAAAGTAAAVAAAAATAATAATATAAAATAEDLIVRRDLLLAQESGLRGGAVVRKPCGGAKRQQRAHSVAIRAADKERRARIGQLGDAVGA